MAAQTTFDPTDVPEPVGGYSQAMAVDGATRMLFVSGQVPQEPDGEVPEAFEQQCRLAWRNVFSNLRAAGLGIDDLVEVTTYLTDRAQVQANRTIRLEFLGEHRPASTVLIAQTLDPRWLLEIKAVAAR